MCVGEGEELSSAVVVIMAMVVKIEMVGKVVVVMALETVVVGKVAVV